MTDLLHNFIHNTPDQATAIVAGALLIIGFIIWLFGAHLVRLICVITALVIGGVGGAIIGEGNIINHQYLLPVIIVCAIVSGILAWLFFRIWVALIGAGVLAIIVPVASFAWQGTVPTIPKQNNSNNSIQLSSSQPELTIKQDELVITKPTARATDPSSASQPETDSTENSKTKKASIHIPLPENLSKKPTTQKTQPTTQSSLTNETSQKAKNFYNHQKKAVLSWWDNNRDDKGNNMIYLSIVIAVTVGLMLGIAAPYVASSLESAIVGAGLIFFSVIYLLHFFLPASSNYLPAAPRTIFYILAALALLGFLFQWILFHKVKDN